MIIFKPPYGKESTKLRLNSCRMWKALLTLLKRLIEFIEGVSCIYFRVEHIFVPAIGS